MDLKATYNKIAEHWVKDHSSDDWWKEGTDHLLSLLPKGARILDVGCGGGHKSKYLHSQGFNVLGVDFSENMLAQAKKNNPDISFVVLDAFDVETLNEKFDCVFAQAMLLHIPKSRVLEVLTKFKNVLKENGLLYVAVKEIKEGQQEEIIQRENDYGYEYERFFSFYTMPELEKDFQEIGIDVVWKNISTSGKTNWLQIIGKNI